VNPEIRYWHDRVRAAEAELDAATTHADLKLAAHGLMRARRLLVLHTQETKANNPRPPSAIAGSRHMPETRRKPDVQRLHDTGSNPACSGTDLLLVALPASIGVGRATLPAVADRQRQVRYALPPGLVRNQCRAWIGMETVEAAKAA
jgi:hypothetical protein